jgi:hypothetical protein
MDQGDQLMTDWHTWDKVRDEPTDALDNTNEQAQQAEQLHRERALQHLAKLRKQAGPRQIDVAERRGTAKTRINHIEHGAMTTIDLLARYLDAIDGRPEITAAFDGSTERIALD